MNGYILELLQREHGVDKESMVKFDKYNFLGLRGAYRLNIHQQPKPPLKAKMLNILVGPLNPYKKYSVIG